MYAVKGKHGLYVFTFKNRVPLLLKVSGVASFITTDEQLQLNRNWYFPMQAVIPEGFCRSQLNSTRSYKDDQTT